MNQKTYRSASDALFEASGYHLPDERGHFGPYGGIFVSETLIHALDELKQAYALSLIHISVSYCSTGFISGELPFGGIGAQLHRNTTKHAGNRREIRVMCRYVRE